MSKTPEGEFVPDFGEPEAQAPLPVPTGSDSEKLLKLIATCRKVQDVFDAALTMPDDAGYRADAWDALAELERVSNEADSPNDQALRRDKTENQQ